MDRNPPALDLDLVRSVAPYFRIKDAQATSIIDRIAAVVGDWSEIAGTLGIKRSEQADMSDAFMKPRG